MNSTARKKPAAVEPTIGSVPRAFAILRRLSESQGEGARALCRPALLRLSASLGDTIFLLVRSGFDAICLDRSEGPFPIRSFTGDIGGRVALGIGQGAMAILAHLPE